MNKDQRQRLKEQVAREKDIHKLAEELERERRERQEAERKAQAEARGGVIEAVIPADASPKKPPRKKGEQLTYACGHKEGVAAITNHPCPMCRSKARRERNARTKQKQTVKAAQAGDTQRLPHGSAFSLLYNAEKKEWTGSLWTGEHQAFQGSQSGVFRLLQDLDRQYRESIKEEGQ